MMRWRSTFLMALTAAATFSPAAVQVYACVELEGIVSGGGEGLLDLDEMLISLEDEPYDLSNPTIPTVAECATQLETPIYMRALLGIDAAVFSIASMFHSNEIALDVFGDTSTSDARRRCQPDAGEDSTLFDLHLRVAIVYTFVYSGYLYMPYCLETLEALMNERNHSLSLILDEDASLDTPWGVAKTYAEEVFDFLLENDGWNADGSASRDVNLVPFSDYAITDSAGNSWSPFVPANSPYEVTDNTKWQALSETDDLGYIFFQSHVTPHIGAVARFFGFNSTEDETTFYARTAANPNYTYETLVTALIEETATTAEDTFKLAAISFFDNKFTSLIPLKISYFTSSETTGLTAQDFYRLTFEVQLAMYNGLLLTWKEKILWNMPRPQTVAKEYLGDTLVEAYAGSDNGVQTIKASEWEPFVRTMPHTEYTSASSCLCTLFAEQVSSYLGNDAIDPALEYDNGDYTFEFSSWSEIAETCGNSRVWGGLHFDAAITAGEELCGGSNIADSVSATLTRLINGDETAAVFDKNVGELMVREV